MRLAPLALLVAACSSPATTTPTAHPADDVRAPVDAAPVAIEAPPRVTPDAEPGPCLPLEYELIGFEADDLVLCRPEEEGVSGSECVRVARDGAVADFYDRSIDLSDTYAAYEDASVEACIVGNCKTLRPSVGKLNHVVDAALDARGGSVVIALHDERLGVATVEVWDLGTAKRIARATVEHHDAKGLSYAVGFAGDRVVVEVTFESSGLIDGSLWKVVGAKLTKMGDLAGDLGTWAELDGGRGVFQLDDRIAIVDLTSGAVVNAIEWRTLLGDDDGDASVELVADDDRLGLAVRGDEEHLVAVGVATVDGEVTAYDARICPEPRVDHLPRLRCPL